MGAPKGNLFALGNTGGRPPFYETPEAFCDKLDEYIKYEDSCKKGSGTGIYTLEGAALFLGFSTRQSLYDYAAKEEFTYILNRFRLFLTNWNVKKLYWGGTMPGAKFWLTNHGGYTEETHQTITNNNVAANFGSIIQPPSEPKANP
jgi:hypothetical protein